MPGKSFHLPGLGSIQMWGLSPSQNLLDYVADKECDPTFPKQVNILLFGEADLRHSIKTLASSWEKFLSKEVYVNFYILENSLDLYARQMILWNLAFEALEDKGLYEKTIQFMDLFGNLHIRPQTKKYLLASIEKLIKLITYDNKIKQEYPMYNFSLLKYREKDQLVEILKYWSKNCEVEKIDLTRMWDARLRQHLGSRYDARLGVFDWDYNMNLLDKGENLGIISIQEYKNWRNTGNAFSEYECDYSQPNLTLTTGTTTPSHNYWGDIITGPYISYGIETDKSDFYNKANNKYKNKSFDVTKYNLEQIFANISSQTQEERLDSLQESFSLHFVSPSNLHTMIQNGKFNEYFDLIYLANSMVQYLGTNGLQNMMKNDCKVLVEDARFVLELKAEQINTYDNKVLEIAKSAGLEEIEDKDKVVDVGGTSSDKFNCFKIFQKCA